MFLVNSCLGHFSAAWIAPRLPLLRTYGVNLPSSLTTLLPLVLGFSPHPPVSVCGTGTITLDSGFSRQCEITGFGTYISLLDHVPETSSVLNYSNILNAWTRISCSALRLSSCVPASLITSIGSTGISACCPSATPFGLVLGPD